MPAEVTLRAYRAGRAREFGVVWLALAVLFGQDELRRGHGSARWVVSAVIAATCAAVYCWALRPQVAEEVLGVQVRNPLRTVMVPWVGLRDVTVSDVVVLHTEAGQVRCYALPHGRPRPDRPGAAGMLVPATRPQRLRPASSVAEEAAAALRSSHQNLRSGAAQAQVVTGWATDSLVVLAVAGVGLLASLATLVH